MKISIQTSSPEDYRHLLKHKQLITKLHVVNINKEGASVLPVISDLQISSATGQCELISLLHPDFISTVQRISSNEPFSGFFENDRVSALIGASGMQMLVTEELYQKLGVQTNRSKQSPQLRAVASSFPIADNRPMKEVYLSYADAPLIERCTQNLLQSQHIHLSPGALSISCCSSDSLKMLAANLSTDSLHTSTSSYSDKSFSFFDPSPIWELCPNLDQCQDSIDDALLWIGALIRQPNVLVAASHQKVDPFISTASLEFNSKVCSVAHRTIECMAPMANGQLCQVISDHLSSFADAVVIVALGTHGVDFVIVHRPSTLEMHLIQF